MKIYLILICLAVMLGCTPKENRVKQIGPKSYIISCPNDGTDCYTEAFELCPNGYTIEREYSDLFTGVPSCIFITCDYISIEELEQKINGCKDKIQK